MEPMILAEQLGKTYQISKYQKTVRGLLKNLFKREFQLVNAVQNISFAIEAGSCVGFIGPNGAGKSTTIKMMTGVLYPSSGRVTVHGLEPYRDRQKAAKKIGVLFGQRTQLWHDLPVIDSFELLREIYEIPPAKYEENLRVFSERLGLAEFLHQPVRKLSLGQRVRADFAASLLHDPPVVFLDEPTIGLDVIAKETVREFILFMNRERGVTFILTTHDMNDIEAVCDRVMIIDKGRIIHDSDLDQLRDAFGTSQWLTIEFVHPDRAATFATDRDLHVQLGLELQELSGRHVTVSFDRSVWSSYQLVERIAKQEAIRDIKTSDVPIETVIRRYYERSEVAGGVEET